MENTPAINIVELAIGKRERPRVRLDDRSLQPHHREAPTRCLDAERCQVNGGDLCSSRCPQGSHRAHTATDLQYALPAKPAIREEAVEGLLVVQVPVPTQERAVGVLEELRVPHSGLHTGMQPLAVEISICLGVARPPVAHLPCFHRRPLIMSNKARNGVVIAKARNKASSGNLEASRKRRTASFRRISRSNRNSRRRPLRTKTGFDGQRRARMRSIQPKSIPMASGYKSTIACA